MEIEFTMGNPIEQFFREMEMPGMTQDSVALTYAFIMAQEPNADWPKINAAISARWKGRTALARVKKMAWKQFDEWRSRRAQA